MAEESDVPERFESVTEFLSEIVESVKDNEGLQTIREHLPEWAETTTEAVGTWAAPIKIIAKFVGKVAKEHDPEALGYKACTVAYKAAALEALRLVGQPQDIPNLTGREDVVKKIRKLEPPQAGLMRAFSFSRPHAHPFMWSANAQLEEVARYFGYNEREGRRILASVRENFQSCLAALLTDGKTVEKFNPFKEWLAFDSEGYVARAKLLEHTERQRRAFAERPVLNIEPFALADVYIETECGDLSWGEIVGNAAGPTGPQQPKNPFLEENGGRGALLKKVLALLGKEDYPDAIVIQGAPGSGKSVFTQKLCSVLLKEGLQPVRVRLKNLEHTGRTIWEDMSQAIQRVDETDPDPPSDFVADVFLGGQILDGPVPFGNTRISPYVLIFDGWDEISRSGSRSFQDRVKDTLERVRKEILQRPGRIRVILTGRPSEAIGEASFLKATTRILTVRSLRPDQVEGYVRKLSRLLDDPPIQPAADNKVKGWKLAGVERFGPIFSQYAKEFGSDGSSRQARLDVLGQPLLLHLAVRVIAEWKGDIEELISSPTALYRNLVDLTSAGGKFVEDPGRLDYPYPPTGSELRTLLRDIALAIQQYGSETIPQAELEKRLKKPKGALRKDAEKAAADYPLSELMIGFYFKSGPAHLGCEFLHKSFREYLTAEAIVAIVKDYGRHHTVPKEERPDYWRDFHAEDSRYGLSRRLSEALSAQWLRPDVLGHLCELIAWEVDRWAQAPSDALSISQWEEVRTALADLWDWWAEGVHLRNQYGEDGISLKAPYVSQLIELATPRLRDDQPAPPRTVTMDSNLGQGLCQLAVSVHYVLARTSGVLGLQGTAQQCRRCQTVVESDGRTWIRFAPSGQSPEYFNNYANRISSSGTRATNSRDWPSGADLRAVDLRRADLMLLNLLGTKLDHADLSGALLEATSYMGARLRSANLSGTYFVVRLFTGTITHGGILESGNIDRAVGYDEGCLLNLEPMREHFKTFPDVASELRLSAFRKPDAS